RLLSQLATAHRLIELLPAIHQQALAISGGTCSLLLEYNSRTGLLHATSAHGLEALPTEPWRPAGGEAELVSAAFGRGAPVLVANVAQQMPDLAGRLERASTAALLPLEIDGRRGGLLVVGFQEGHPTPDASDEWNEVVDALTLALELFRLRQRESLQN